MFKINVSVLLVLYLNGFPQFACDGLHEEQNMGPMVVPHVIRALRYAHIPVGPSAISGEYTQDKQSDEMRFMTRVKRQEVEEPPAEGEEPPAEGETPPAEGETPPPAEGTKPAEEATPPPAVVTTTSKTSTPIGGELLSPGEWVQKYGDTIKQLMENYVGGMQAILAGPI